MLERDDISDEMISGDAGGIGGAWVAGRCRGTLVDRPGSDLRRLDVFASWVPAVRGNSGGTVSSFGAILRSRISQSNATPQYRTEKSSEMEKGNEVKLRV